MDSSEYDSEKTLPPGTYTLTETKAPLGYRVDQAPRTLEITMDAVNSKYWDNPIVNEYGEGYVQLSNLDTVSGLPIEGAVFDLSQCESFSPGRYDTADNRGGWNDSRNAFQL